MSATITNATRVHSAISFIKNFSTEDLYLFAGRVNPWTDENSPDPVSTTYSDIRNLKKSNVFMKKSAAVGSTLGLKRNDWTSGIIYTAWDDQEDMYPVDTLFQLPAPFHVMVVDSSPDIIQYNVYICLDNNYGGVSTVQPFGQLISPVTYGDGYKWKFMYSVSDAFLNYISDAFVPCPYLDIDKSDAHLSVQANAIPGTIDKLEIIDPGLTYTTATITVTGDGTGCTISPIIDAEGKITQYNISNAGAGYSYAIVTVIGDGVNANIRAVISPLEGHGYDVSMQLGASHVLYKESFLSDEGGFFPYVSAYRRIGLIRGVKDHSSNYLSGSQYDLTDQIKVTNVSGDFLFSGTIIGSSSGATAVLYNIIADDFFITDKVGEFIAGESIYLSTDLAVIAAITEINNNITVDITTGDVIYYENMQPVTRRSGQSETFIFSVEY